MKDYMVQVWEKGAWSDYWPVTAEHPRSARVHALAALSIYWRTKRWRVGRELNHD
jgi:hypothetical protein